MEDTLPPLEHKALSASRIKVFEDCSWLYWANYHLKVPQTQNEGAKKGNVCHTVFEVLLSPRRRKHYDAIVAAGTIRASPSITRLVQKHLNAMTIGSVEVFEDIDKMILVGLKTEFHVPNGELIEAEFQFSIENKEPNYLIKGFIDKPVKKGKNVFIDDFKSSKQKFEGEQIKSNVQGMIYSLAATKLWPKLKPLVRFIFLRFPEEPLQEVSFSKDALAGFEHYLAAIQKKVDSFSEKDAKSNYAFDKGEGKGGFSGRIMCGFATRRGQLKKDGKPMWHCPYKFAFNYYVIKDKVGNIIASSLNNDLTPKEGEVVEEVKYDGCPRHKDPLA